MEVILIKKASRRYPLWYFVCIILAYLSPLISVEIFIFFSMVSSGVFSAIFSFFPATVLAFFMFLPYVAKCYCVILLLHTLFDEIFFCVNSVKIRILSVGLSLSFSSALTALSIISIKTFEHDYGWIPYFSTLFALFFIFYFVAGRIALEFLLSRRNSEKQRSK